MLIYPTILKLGRNDSGPKRPTYQGRNDPPPKLAETTQVETTRPKRPRAETTRNLPRPHLHPPPNPPVVYSTDRSKAVVLVFLLLSVALCFPHCFLFFSIHVCVVMLLWSPSSAAAYFAFCFTSCVVVLAFRSPSTAAQFAFCFTSCN